MFQVAFNAFGVSSAGSAALQAVSGPVGGFFFAPQFDASQALRPGPSYWCSAGSHPDDEQGVDNPF